MPDETTRAGVGQHVIDFDGRQSCINWDGNYSQPTARIHQLDIIGAVGQEESQAVSWQETLLSRRLKLGPADADNIVQPGLWNGRKS